LDQERIFKDHKGRQDPQEHKALREHKVIKVLKDQQVLKEQLDLRVLKVIQGSEDPKGQQETQVLKEL
jgi:hypothetical protein